MAILADRKKSLTDIAYQELKSGILTGRLPADSKLVVNDLAVEWKISNTPIKEALNRLVSEGLVVFAPRRGMWVRRTLTLKEVREKYEIRKILEVHCCRVAVRSLAAHPDAIGRMTETLEETYEMLDDEKSFVHLYQLDERFHRCIVGLCGNDEIIEGYRQLSSTIAVFGVQVSKGHPLRRQVESYREHMDILAAMKKGDADAMSDAMSLHLDRSMRHVVDFHRMRAEEPEAGDGRAAPRKNITAKKG